MRNIGVSHIILRAIAQEIKLQRALQKTLPYRTNYAALAQITVEQHALPCIATVSYLALECAAQELQASNADILADNLHRFK